MPKCWRMFLEPISSPGGRLPTYSFLPMSRERKASRHGPASEMWEQG